MTIAYAIRFMSVNPIGGETSSDHGIAVSDFGFLAKAFLCFLIFVTAECVDDGKNGVLSVWKFHFLRKLWWFCWLLFITGR